VAAARALLAAIRIGIFGSWADAGGGTASASARWPRLAATFLEALAPAPPKGGVGKTLRRIDGPKVNSRYDGNDQDQSIRR
jgi:hypothetical protein